MNIKNLTGSELLPKSSLKNKILAEIPNTPFHILFTLKQKTGKWDIHLLQLATTNREQIRKNVSATNVKKYLTTLLNSTKVQKLQKIKGIKQFAEELKTLIT